MTCNIKMQFIVTFLIFSIYFVHPAISNKKLWQKKVINPGKELHLPSTHPFRKHIRNSSVSNQFKMNWNNYRRHKRDGTNSILMNGTTATQLKDLIGYILDVDYPGKKIYHPNTHLLQKHNRNSSVSDQFKMNWNNYRRNNSDDTNSILTNVTIAAQLKNLIGYILGVEYPGKELHIPHIHPFRRHNHNSPVPDQFKMNSHNFRRHKRDDKNSISMNNTTTAQLKDRIGYILDMEYEALELEIKYFLTYLKTLLRTINGKEFAEADDSQSKNYLEYVRRPSESVYVFVSVCIVAVFVLCSLAYLVYLLWRIFQKRKKEQDIEMAHQAQAFFMNEEPVGDRMSHLFTTIRTLSSMEDMIQRTSIDDDATPMEIDDTRLKQALLSTGECPQINDLLSSDSQEFDFDHFNDIQTPTR